MNARLNRLVAWLVFLGCAWSWQACQKISEPIPLLTQDQRQRIQDQLLTEDPQVEHPIGARFGTAVELIGYDIEPDVIEAGGEFTITWYWRVLEEVEDRWEIFVHLDAGAQRQNLDHEAIGGLYTSLYWKQGDIIRDIQTADLAAHMGTGAIGIYLGLWRRVDGTRMEITEPGQGTVDPTGRLSVGSVESRIHLLRHEVARLVGPLVIDGALREPQWRRATNTAAFVHPNDGSEVRGVRTQARLLWDETNLYIGMTAQDQDVWSTIEQRDGDLWDEEVLEVYLDPRGDGRNYVEIQVNPLGTIFDAIFEEANNRNLPAARALDIDGMQAAVEVNGTLNERGDRDRRWSAEILIPWQSLPDFGPQANPGDTLRANFYRYDRPAEGDALTVAWSPVFGGSFHQPDKFGELVLVDGGEGEGQAEEAAEEGEQPAQESFESLPAGEGTGAGTRVFPRESPAEAVGGSCGGGRRTGSPAIRAGIGLGTGSGPERRININRIRAREPVVPLIPRPAETGP